MLTKMQLYLINLCLIIFITTACGVTPSLDTNQNDVDNMTNINLQLPEMTSLSLQPGQKLKVVATTSIVGDIVYNIAKDNIDLTVLLPPDTDPHTFSPAPQDIALIASADVIFTNGFGLEQFLTQLIENAGSTPLIVPLSTGVQPLTVDEHLATDDNHPDQVDPHTWMNPLNVIVFTRNIEYTLTILNPANTQDYQVNATVYVAKLKQLDRWIKSQIETIPPPNRKLVTDHEVFGYYVHQYGLELVGTIIPTHSTDAEPSAYELATLQDIINKHQVKAVFIDITTNTDLAKRIANDTTIKLVQLYTGSLGISGSGAETYIDYMEFNTNAIVNALK